METMKRNRRRLVVSFLTTVAMVFTLVLCMGTDVAEAATNDLVQTYTPTYSCPVSKVEFVPQSDGQFNLKVTVDLDVLYVGDGYGFDLSIKNNATGKTLAGEQSLLDKSGEKVFEYEKDDLHPNYSLIQNQGITIKFSLFDTNPQYDPDPINSPTELNCTAPSLFTGFSAEYKEGESDEWVEVKYDRYSGDDYKYNIYQRENPSAGTIKVISYGDVYRSKYDYQFKPATKYIYYVAKQSSFEKILPDLYGKVGSTEVAFSAEDKAKLCTISAYASVTVPGPRIVNVNNLKVSPDIRQASLTWKYNYETILPNVTGFYVRVYSSNGSLYKKYEYTDYKIQDSVYCSATYSIPYKGTYYFTVTPYYVYEGETYEGNTTDKVSCTSKSLSSASGSVTKISNKKVRITIKKATGSTGTMIYQNVSGKWKYIGKTTGDSYTVTKNTAGKKKYRLLSYIDENDTTYKADKYSGTYSPKANVAKFSYSNYPSSYKQLSHYWRPNKIYYSGKKVVVEGKFINTHIYTLDYCKIKLTVKCQGKVIGTKTINSGKLKPNQVKKVTVKLDKSKTGYDLRGSFVGWDYKVISYH